MADDNIKNRLAEERAAREKSQAEHREAQSAVKPTPTQAENDLAASGVHIIEHEHDGSPDEGAPPNVKRQAEANKPAAGRGDYSTRAMEQPKPTPAHDEPKAKP